MKRMQSAILLYRSMSVCPSSARIVSKRLYIQGYRSSFPHITYGFEILIGRGRLTQVGLEKFRNFWPENT